MNWVAFIFVMIGLGLAINESNGKFKEHDLWLECIETKTNNCLGVELYDHLQEQCSEDITKCSLFNKFEDAFGGY